MVMMGAVMGPPGLDWGNLARDVGLCVQSRTKLQAGIKLALEDQAMGLGLSTPLFSRRAIIRANCPMGRECSLAGAKGAVVQALKLISVFFSLCCLGPGSFQTNLR